MKVIRTGYMPDGTRIQVEDWRGDYDIMPDDERAITAYPVYAGKEKIRPALIFKTGAVDGAFYALREGKRELWHYAGHLTLAHREMGYGQYL